MVKLKLIKINDVVYLPEHSVKKCSVLFLRLPCVKGAKVMRKTSVPAVYTMFSAFFKQKPGATNCFLT